MGWERREDVGLVRIKNPYFNVCRHIPVIPESQKTVVIIVDLLP